MDKIFSLILGVLFSCSSFVFAVSEGMPKAAKKQVNQNQRIVQGVRTGELTKEEAKDLRQGQKEVRQLKKEARSDGKVTKEERKEIQQKLNLESKEIYQEKHDLEKHK
jgi:uncharacterized membrane protein YebE (DUF533 family)